MAKAVGAGTTTSYTAYGAPMATPNQEVNGTTVLQDDTQVWLEVNASGSVPKVGDVCTISGIAYRVISIKNYIAQGAALLYKLQVRI